MESNEKVKASNGWMKSQLPRVSVFLERFTFCVVMSNFCGIDNLRYFLFLTRGVY